MAEDDLRTPPSYTAGVSIHDLPRTIVSPGTRLVSSKRPAGRIPQEEE